MITPPSNCAFFPTLLTHNILQSTLPFVSGSHSSTAVPPAHSYYDSQQWTLLTHGTCSFKHCLRVKVFILPAHLSRFTKTIIQGSDRKCKRKESNINTINVCKMCCIATICHIATLVQCWSNERNHQELLWNMRGLLYLDV